MKRTYIKPFMESEEFVTNEYVAACWMTKCVDSITGGICDYNDNPLRFKGSDDEKEAANNFISANGNSGALHQGQCNDDNVQHGPWYSYESTDLYYHTTDVPGVHHRLNFIRDTTNHS